MLILKIAKYKIEVGEHMKLPKEFMERMEKLLKNEYGDYLASYTKEHFKGIRVNTLKISVDDFLKISPFKLEKVNWSEEGFYLNEDDTRPGKHPYYHCGLYYIQEPSAMIPVEVLEPKPGEKILDISAAPGGKATQIGAKLKGQGLLVANDISPKRVKALTKNVEVFGIKNCIITNDTPENIANNFKSYFDKILVDAPCSGEGMFRKDTNAIKNWNQFSVEQCCTMQRNILRWVPSMLKPDGKLVYSTCTFSPEENEGTIEWFLKEFPEFELVEINKIDELDRGRPEWIGGIKELRKTRRAWPHKIKGEGHFIALFKKVDGEEEKLKSFEKKIGNIESFLEFSKEYLNYQIDTENIHTKGNKLFLIPGKLPDLTGIRTANLGVFLGEVNRNRFKPSQALAMILRKDKVKNTLNLDSENIESIKYLKGETIITNGEKGWRLVCIDEYPVGWGKQTNSFLKNYYRPEWRMV